MLESFLQQESKQISLQCMLDYASHPAVVADGALYVGGAVTAGSGVSDGPTLKFPISVPVVAAAAAMVQKVPSKVMERAVSLLEGLQLPASSCQAVAVLAVAHSSVRR